MSDHRRHPYSAAALNAPPTNKRRPSLASPLPPTPIVPSTPLPRASPSVNQPAYQPRPTTATSTSSANLSDSPSTRGMMMKRLLAKPAPPSSSSVPSWSDHPKTYQDEQDLVQEITLPPRTDSLLPPQSPNEFDKSIRALDLVGQIDISMAPTETYTSLEFIEINSDLESTDNYSTNKHRNVLRRRPSGTTKITTIYLPSSSESSLEGFSTSTTPTPSTIKPLPLPPIRFQSSSPSPTRHPIRKSTSFNDSNPTQPYDTQFPKLKSPESPAGPYDTVFGDTPDRVAAAGSPGDSFWDTHGEYWVSKDKQQCEDGGGGYTRALTRTVSGKWKRNDSDYQLRSRASLRELNKASVDKDEGMVKTSPVSPSGGRISPSRRLWTLMKKISVPALREKTLPGHPPPVPPLPYDLANGPHQPTPHTSPSSDSSAVQTRAGDSGMKKFPTSSTSVLALSSTTPLGKANKATLAPLSSAQPKLPQSVPQPASSQIATGPRQSTTTRSSSPSSDVGSSHFFNRPQSPRSSTSSFGEEIIPLPPLPVTPKTNNITDANDTTASRKLQQHIIPPSELGRHHSTSKFPTNTPTNNPVPIHPPPPSMEDDWTIVRSPSVELEAFSLPPPPRQPLKGDRHKGAGGQGNKQSRVKAKANVVTPTLKVLKAVNISSEELDEKSRDVASNACLDGRKEVETKITVEDTIKMEQGDKELEYERSHADPDSDQSQSPTIPSFSTTSAINSFPARRVSPSLSSRGSPISLSPARSRSSAGSSTIRGMAPSSPAPPPPRTSERLGPRSTFGRVRQHLFGTNDDRLKVAETNGSLLRTLDIQMAHLQQLYSPLYPPPEYRAKSCTHHRHSSGSTTSNVSLRATHVTATSISVPTSPITIHPHRRSMSFHTSSPSQGLLTSARSPPSPLESLPPPHFVSRSLEPKSSPSLAAVSGPQMILSPPPLPSSPPLTPSCTLSSSNLRSGFSGKKLSDVLFSSSASPSASPGISSASVPRARSSSSVGQRTTFGTLMSRSISTGTNNHSPPRSQLTDQEKADKWNDLLARSARAGGTLHLAAGGRLLGSDDI